MRGTAIVGYNASDGSEDALAFACMLRRMLGYDIVVVSCVVDPLERVAGHHLAKLHRDANDALSSARAAVEDDRDVRFVAMTGTSAGRVLHDAAERYEADLIVIGATHRRHSAELFTPSVTHQTIQAAPCAVAVPPAGFRDRPHGQLSRMTVAFDDSEEALAALRQAADWARATGARVRAVHAFHPVLAAAPLAAFSYGDPDYVAETRAYAEARLQHAVTTMREEAPELEFRASLVSGDPSERLVQASERADLLFLGSRGYGPLRRALLGSVSGRIVRVAHCPVVVTPRAAVARDREHETGSAEAVAA